MNKIDFKHKVFSLSERLFPMVARMLGSTANAEDAIQEVMLKLWKKRKQVEKHPNIKYLIVGGASLEGNIEEELKSQAEKLGVTDHVIFCGPQPPEALHKFLSAADVFVLATANEGWANVLLEALACGTPVIATDVGGNSEVINHSSLGEIVPFGNHDKLLDALDNGLIRNWERLALVRYAEANHWNYRIQNLKTIFDRISK